MCFTSSSESDLPYIFAGNEQTRESPGATTSAGDRDTKRHKETQRDIKRRKDFDNKDAKGIIKEQNQ